MSEFNQAQINNFTIEEVIRYADIQGPFAERILDIVGNHVTQDEAQEREEEAREEGYEEGSHDMNMTRSEIGRALDEIEEILSYDNLDHHVEHDLKEVRKILENA